MTGKTAIIIIQFQLIIDINRMEYREKCSSSLIAREMQDKITVTPSQPIRGAKVKRRISMWSPAMLLLGIQMKGNKHVEEAFALSNILQHF